MHIIKLVCHEYIIKLLIQYKCENEMNFLKKVTKIIHV